MQSTKMQILTKMQFRTCKYSNELLGNHAEWFVAAALAAFIARSARFVPCVGGFIIVKIPIVIIGVEGNITIIMINYHDESS